MLANLASIKWGAASLVTGAFAAFSVAVYVWQLIDSGGDVGEASARTAGIIAGASVTVFGGIRAAQAVVKLLRGEDA